MGIWGFPKDRGIPKWMVYMFILKWMIWGYHYFWKHPYGVFNLPIQVVSKAEDLLVEKKSQELLTLVTSGKVSVTWHLFSWSFCGFDPMPIGSMGLVYLPTVSSNFTVNVGKYNLHSYRDGTHHH